MPTVALDASLRGFKTLFTKRRMTNAWKQTVRQGLRRQQVEDLHDYLDVHSNLNLVLARLRSDILNGTYRPQAPYVISCEKKNGVMRRMAIPTARDAIILQTIIDKLERRALANSPCPQSAFYSRSHKGPSLDDLDTNTSYPWWILWPRFQKRVHKFTIAKRFVACTDISNYFDCIPRDTLRSSLTSAAKFDRSVVDFLFYILNEFAWHPEYTQQTQLGLPQLNFDAPRLLAHLFLFDLDRLLHKQTQGSSARWMDDITFGADTEAECKRILHDLNEFLSGLGLKLNLGKTEILASANGAKHFWISENQFLNKAKRALDRVDGSERSEWHRRCRRRFASAFVWRHPAAKRRLVGHWDKVLKRYLRLLGELGDTSAEKKVEIWLRAPSLRDALFRYFTELGYAERRFHVVRRFLRTCDARDDAAFFGAVRLLTHWEVPVDSGRRSDIVDLGFELGHRSRATPVSAASASWLIAKYGDPLDPDRYLWTTRPKWELSEWAARQFASAWPRYSVDSRERLQGILETRGHWNAISVVRHHQTLERMTELTSDLRNYLTAKPKEGHPYPLPKVLTAMTLLQGPNLDSRHWLLEQLLKITTDGVYHGLLKGGVAASNTVVPSRSRRSYGHRQR